MKRKYSQAFKAEMVKKTRVGEAPSVRATRSRRVGTAVKASRAALTRNGRETNAIATDTAATVPVMPSPSRLPNAE